MERPDHTPRPVALHRASFGPTDDLIRRVADTDVTVLLRGERGTGKEQAARAIHDASSRRFQSFVKVNCAAPPSRLEIELFGCDACAGTGGTRHRPGRLEFASHGTLFLDRVNELPHPIQQRFLALLEARELAHSGGASVSRMDARLIASSEEDLESAVAGGAFLEGLYLRLNVVCLTLPPLRQRREELPALTEFFVRQYSARFNKLEIGLSEQACRLLAGYDWPGNLEELGTVIKRMVMRGTEEGIGDELRGAASHPSEPSKRASRGQDHQVVPNRNARRADAPAPVPDPPSALPLKLLAREAADLAERELIFQTLQRTRWNRREAAEMLGVSYKALLSKIKRAELDGAC